MRAVRFVVLQVALLEEAPLVARVLAELVLVLLVLAAPRRPQVGAPAASTLATGLIALGTVGVHSRVHFKHCHCA